MIDSILIRNLCTSKKAFTWGEKVEMLRNVLQRASIFALLAFCPKSRRQVVNECKRIRAFVRNVFMHEHPKRDPPVRNSETN